MAIELAQAINDTSAWLTGSRASRAVFRNPLYTALLLTVIVLMIVVAVLDESRASRARAGFWVLVALSSVLFVHYQVVARHFHQRRETAGVASVVGAINNTAVGGGGYAVRPGAGAPTYAPSRAPPRAPAYAPPYAPTRAPTRAPPPARPPSGLPPPNLPPLNIVDAAMGPPAA